MFELFKKDIVNDIDYAYFYLERYENREIYHSRFKFFTKYIALALFILILILFLCGYVIPDDHLYFDVDVHKYYFVIENNYLDKSMWCLALVLFQYPVVIFYHKLFYKLKGKKLEHLAKHEQTKRFAFEVLEGFVHIDALGGMGKDSLQSHFVLSYDEQLRLDLDQKLTRLERYLYPFNLAAVKSIILFTNVMADASESRSQENFEKSLSSSLVIFKKYYRDEMNIKEVLKDKITFNNDRTKSVYTRTDTINYYHLLDDLFEWAYIYYRLHVLKIFILANQPFLDNDYNPVMIFSERFFWFKTKYDALTNPENKEDKNVYVPKTKFPLGKYNIVSLTEQDILNNNFDKALAKAVGDTGTKDFHNSKRHYCKEQFIIFSNAQVDGRQALLIRENYTFKISIDRKPHLVSLNEKKETKLLNKIEKLDYKISKNKSTVEDLRLEKAELYQTIDDAYVVTETIKETKIRETKNKKARNKITKINNKIKDLTNPDKVHEKNVRRKELDLKLNSLKYESYLHMSITVRPKNNEGVCNETSLSDLLDRDKSYKLQGFKVDLVLKPQLAWGHNDTYFLRHFADIIRRKSVMSLADVPVWNGNKIFTKEQAIQIDSTVLDKYLDLSFEQTSESRYDKVEKPKQDKKRKTI